jgi:hypothetical protein
MFKKLSGECSLFASEEFLKSYPNPGGKASPYRCKEIIQVTMSPCISPHFSLVIWKFSCGHYMTPQGQHRCCIAGSLKKTMPVELQVYDYKCDYCEGQKGMYFKKRLK